MSAAFPCGTLTIIPSQRGKITVSGMTGLSIGVFRFDSDPIGTAIVKFRGVNAGSEIRVYLTDGSEAAGVESCDADHSLTWSAYASGSVNNTVIIRIIHPSFRIKEFTYETQNGSQQIPIQQEPDKWYLNPA